MHKNIAIVFGCGGHRAQATRFYREFCVESDINFFAMTDEGKAPSWSERCLVLEPLRNKYTGRLVSPFKFALNVSKSYHFLKENRISTLVSFGPGVAIFAGVAAKLTGCSIIHFETWSKFHSPSWTTRVMRHLTKHIFIQNIELKDKIPYGKYVGRL
ncbi:PssD/Cps14F family polysaccharide biosynthesis glycosyltransferase [Salinivibrio sp. SS2]|uniref:PssD/Cps14F family polysaccharide biosynthesis glycosyltransferase n=1 Tax=Salinivibrio sp. SS2 TaxID=1892894 RepID=UPI00084BFE12|nr:PssD/Cps14F family polysaccharide biosynthesis glycosyltransferase [Salinivibrio sp. DV]ODP99267.1 hypothetical protein BGK46_10910 [Salinivibrio sp. DV]